MMTEGASTTLDDRKKNVWLPIGTAALDATIWREAKTRRSCWAPWLLCRAGRVIASKMAATREPPPPPLFLYIDAGGLLLVEEAKKKEERNIP